MFSRSRFLATSASPLAIIISMLATGLAWAGDWTGAVDTDWFNAANWSDGVVPGTDPNVPAFTPATGHVPVISGAPTGLVPQVAVGPSNPTAPTDATLTVVDGGVLNTQVLFVYSSGGQSTMKVSGRGSRLDASGLIIVGYFYGGGHSSLELSAGAVATGTDAYVAVAQNGAWPLPGNGINDSGFGRVDLSGNGTAWSMSGALRVGIGLGSLVGQSTDPQSFTGEIRVTEGAALSNVDADLGRIEAYSVMMAPGMTAIDERTAGRVSVDGPGSRWSNRGTLSLGSIALMPDLRIDGSGALSVDARTSGALMVTDGGVVSSQAAYLGQIGGAEYTIDPEASATAAIRLSAVGSVLVSGAGSRWNNAGDIIAGAIEASRAGAGAGVTVDATAQGILRIADGGTIAAGGRVVLAQDPGSLASLTIGGERGEAPSAPGALAAEQVAFGKGEGEIVFNHTADAYVFDKAIARGIAGDGLIETLSGRTILTRDSSAFAGTAQLTGGSLQVNGSLGGSVDIGAGGTLEGVGTVGSVISAGTIAPGPTPAGTPGLAGGTAARSGVQGAPSIGTLTVAGDYDGKRGSIVRLDAVLGNDRSAGDRLVITGDTSGASIVQVRNIGGKGAATTDGIKVIDVGGRSGARFALASDYVFRGMPAIVAGAYAYGLYKNGLSTPTDGDWYLRSSLQQTSPPNAPPSPSQPLYQPGAPVYEVYPQALLAMTRLPTLQDRIGNRQWAGAGSGVLEQGDGEGTAALAPFAEGSGPWGRVEGGHGSISPDLTTTSAAYDQNIWRAQVGFDAQILEQGDDRLVAGLNVFTGTGSADIGSVFGDGSIDSTAYGFGGTLTWYGGDGFYADGQAQAIWFDSDLRSSLAHGLTGGNDANALALALELGQRLALDEHWALTPQLQLTYARVDFDGFTDPFGARISLDRADSLRGRLGVAAGYENAWQAGDGTASRVHLTGLANLHNEFADATDVLVSGVDLLDRSHRLWGSLGLDGSYAWDDSKYAVYAQASAGTPLEDFGGSYTVAGTAGFRMKW